MRRIGAGRGAPFAEPNGLALLPPGLAPYGLVVADTANHVLRGVRLAYCGDVLLGAGDTILSHDRISEASRRIAEKGALVAAVHLYP